MRPPMKVEPHIRYLKLIPETRLEADLLKHFWGLRPYNSSATFSNGDFLDLQIGFMEVFDATNTR